jgi:hypothetical protein
MKQRLLVCISDLPVELISAAGHALGAQRTEHGVVPGKRRRGKAFVLMHLLKHIHGCG